MGERDSSAAPALRRQVVFLVRHFQWGSLGPVGFTRLAMNMQMGFRWPQRSRCRHEDTASAGTPDQTPKRRFLSHVAHRSPAYFVVLLWCTMAAFYDAVGALASPSQLFTDNNLALPPLHL